MQESRVSSLGSAGRRSSKVNSKRRQSSRSSRESRESKLQQANIHQKENADAEQDTNNYRQAITDSFFESFLATLILDKKPMKNTSQTNIDSHSSLALNSLSGEFSNNSYLSAVSMVADDSKYSSFHSKAKMIPGHTESFQKTTSISNQSMVDASTETSCGTDCTCTWRITFNNGNVYEGQLNVNLMEGQGTFYWSDGTIYKGQFIEGYPSGPGKLLLPDLSSYEGEFCMGFFHGNGNFNIKSSPILYNGEWKLSRRNGKGWLLYDTNNWYDGDWVDDRKHGNGYRHYKNGDRYKGGWLNDRISGEGSMMWHNNDYYNGEWSNGYQHGYGEYTWNIIPHDYFTFPNYNWYKGNWFNGQRSGAGIMNFGHESGAKLAGIWLAGKKHGPGVMVCGNGMILEKNPLFIDDKPGAYEKKSKQNISDKLSKKSSSFKTFASISKHILSREKLEELDSEQLYTITKSGSNIKMKQYIKLLEKKADNAPPLKIPIHNVIHNIDFEYFVEIFIKRDLVEKSLLSGSAIEIANIIDGKPSPLVSPSCMNYLSSSVDVTASEFALKATVSQQYLPNSNELKNLIINYLPQLRNIYKSYASMCVEEDAKLPFEPVLIRLFLWQLYRDIGVTEKGGISIVEVDEMLMENPSGCLETAHSPWEPIYFWQFLQALVGVACCLFAAENLNDYTPSNGFIYHMFKNFIERRLLLMAESFQGNSLTRLRNLIPVDSVYKLYKDIGEPHTVEEFLKNACLKKGQAIPCYKTLDSQDGYEYTVKTGANIVILNNQLSYLEEQRTKHHTEETYEGLYKFSSLGRKKILISIYKICPQLLLTNGKYNLQYRLSFIEFYETLLLLAFEKVEQDRRLSITREMGVHSQTEVKSREASRMSTHSGLRRKKSKK